MRLLIQLGTSGWDGDGPQAQEGADLRRGHLACFAASLWMFHAGRGLWQPLGSLLRAGSTALVGTEGSGMGQEPRADVLGQLGDIWCHQQQGCAMGMSPHEGCIGMALNLLQLWAVSHSPRLIPGFCRAFGGQWKI